MKIYSLWASGPLKYMDGNFTIQCKYVFLDKENAEKYKEVFFNNCLNSDPMKISSMNDLEKITKYGIIEFEIYENKM